MILQPSCSAMSSLADALPQLDQDDEAVVRELANELHEIPIASRGACINIARDLLDAGCTSLRGLLECPVNSVQDLQAELGSVPLSILQLRKIVLWMQQQKSLPAPIPPDIGTKRPLSVSHCAPDQGASILRADAAQASSAAVELIVQHQPQQHELFVQHQQQQDLTVESPEDQVSYSNAPPCDASDDISAAYPSLPHASSVAALEDSATTHVQPLQLEACDVCLDDVIPGQLQQQLSLQNSAQAPAAPAPSLLNVSPASAAYPRLSPASASHARPSLADNRPASHDNPPFSHDNPSLSHDNPPASQVIVDYSKLSDLKLCIDYWGIDALSTGSETCAAENFEAVPDFIVGELVLVLQLDWGDDSLGPLRMRLEAKVVDCPAAHERRAGYVLLKYIKGTTSVDGASVWLHKTSFRIQRRLKPEVVKEVKRENQAFDRAKSMKKIDGVNLKNSKLKGHNNFEFEASRLLSKSDQPEGGQVEDQFTATLKQKQFVADDDFEMRTAKVAFKSASKFAGEYHIAARHSGLDCSVHFHFDWADKDEKSYFSSDKEPFISVRSYPCVFPPEDCYNIRVTIEYPESFPETTHHKISVMVLGSFIPDAFEFQWFYKEDFSSAWRPFGGLLQLQNEIETKKQAVRVSSKRFLGHSLEYVKVVIWGAQGLPFAEIVVLIYDDQVERPMPSQGCFIEKKPPGSRMPLALRNK